MSKQFPKTKFPETLYVKQEHDGDETYIVAAATPGALAETGVAVPAAVYELVRAGVVIETKVEVR